MDSDTPISQSTADEDVEAHTMRGKIVDDVGAHSLKIRIRNAEAADDEDVEAHSIKGK